MLKRLISGSVYIAILVGFFLLRQFVDYRLFGVLFTFFCAMGTIEIARAVKKHLYKGNFVLSIVFGILIIPFYFLCQYILSISGLLMALGTCFLFAVIGQLSSGSKRIAREDIAYNILPFLYPSIFIIAMCKANGFLGERGFIALLLIFVISPCSDVMAYLVGLAYSKIRKGNVKKLCPKLSPNKTVAGGIGGLIGGAISGLIIYYIFKDKIVNIISFYPLLVLIGVGFIGSIITQLGDLFESLIKRKVGVKDMGKIMPGHGGVMDRIDGTLFLALFITIVFSFI